MSECSGCNEWKNKYEDLLYYYRQRGNRIDELKKENEKLQNSLDSAESKIYNELEPRIKQEQNSYDIYITSCHGDECYNNGMNGHCGFECSVFGSKIECFETVKSEEDILYIYENYISDGYILDLIEQYGLQEKVKDIDRGILIQRINRHKEEIEKLERELLNI